MKQNQSLASRLGATTRSLTAGTRTLVACTLVLVAVLLLNLLVGLIPKSMTMHDTTPAGQFSVSATSKSYLKSLSEDVTIYVMCPGGTLSPTLESFLARYQSASGHIRVELVDLAKDKTFATKYSGADSLTSYSMIVASARRYRMIEYTNLSYYYINGMGEIPAASYLQLVQSEQYTQLAYQYYTQYGIDITKATPYFRGEQAVTEAIEYVTAETIPHVYVSTGHGEAALGKQLRGFFDQVGLTYDSLDLTKISAMPADISTLLIHAPTSDLSESEADMLVSYVSAGGNILLITSPDNAAMPNLMRVAATMGLSAHTGGVLSEGNANAYGDTPTQLKPSVNSGHTITSGGVENGYAVLLPNAHAIETATTLPTNVTVTPLFATSDAYLYDADGKEVSLGAANVAVAASNSQTGAKLVWFASVEAFSDALVEQKTGNGLYYLAMAASWQSKTFTSKLPTIAPVDLSLGVLETTGMANTIFPLLLIGVIPGGLLAIGITVRAQRKKR
jgi:ABC-2 type transport system permease protein